MTQQKKTGMQLRPARSSRTKHASWLIRTAVAVMACAALVLSVTGLCGFTAGAVPVTAVCVGVFLCVMHGLLLRNGCETWFYLAVLALILLVSLILRPQVLEGFRLFWRQISDAMVRGTGRVLPEWELQLKESQHTLCVCLFTGMIAGLFALLCCCLTTHAPVVLAIVLPGVLLAGMMLFRADHGFIWVLPVLCVAVPILIYSGWRKKGIATPVLMSWALGAVAAVVLISATALPSMQRWGADVSDDIHASIHEKNYETKYTTLPEGDFTSYKDTNKKARSALKVTMEQPQKLYLRGFTGAVFRSNRWEGLDSEALVRNKQLLYWMNLEAFDQNAQFDAAATLAGAMQSKVTVQNVNACSYYRYVPFSIGGGDWADPENLNSDGVYGNGERTYEYMINPSSGEDIAWMLNYLQSSDDPAVLEYRKAESGYRQFVSHYYLQVPEEIKSLLAAQWDSVAASYGGTGNLTPQQLRECAMIFLSRCFPEEGTPEDLELPLDMAEGTSFQYATVAVMTLRYFGAPARYAEGYVISDEMAASAQSGKAISVDSSCARAWVEVYQDGIGWIPMDLTPGMSEMVENTDNTQNNGGGGSSEKNSAKKPEEKKDEKDKQQNSTSGTVANVLLKVALTGILIILLVLLVIVLTLIIRRKILMKRREQRFRSENCSDGIGWIFADSAVLLKKLGFDRGNGSMRDLRDAIETKYGGEFAAQYDCAVDLNDCALFSSRSMEECHRETALLFREQLLEKLTAETAWYRQLWFKWALCLY